MNKHILRHILKSTPKRYTFWNTHLRFKILGICFLLFIIVCLAGCSSKRIVDSRGKSSANVEGDMNRYHDDLYTCEALVKDETNFLVDAGKVVYNSLRFRVLWLSPKLQTRKDYIDNCLEGRGYNIVNKNK